jgi:hypothetical protein
MANYSSREALRCVLFFDRPLGSLPPPPSSFFFWGRYDAWWNLDSFTIARHWFRSCDFRLQFLTPTVFKFLSTESSHVIAGLPTRRVPSGLSRVNLLQGFYSCNIKRWPHHLNRPVTWRLRAGMVETEKTAIARQRFVKRVPAATNLGWRHIHGNDFLKDKKTVLKPLKAVFSIRFSRSYEVRSELVRFRESQISFKVVQGVCRNSSFVIVEGNTLVVQHGMEWVVNSQWL